MTYFKTLIPVVALTVFLGLGTVVGAQGTTTPTTSPAVTQTPAAPNTGAGGNAPVNLAILSASGIVALLGASYLIALRDKKV